jgi:Zn finger protein HypA/HybF involved in hydrogenase expression
MSGITPKRKPTTAEKLKISTKKLSARIQQKKKEAASRKQLVCRSCGGVKVQVRGEVAMASSSIRVSF